LIGFVLPGLALLPHLLSEQRYKRHLNLRLLLALLIAAGVYAVPFVLSHFYGTPTYGQSGLALVFRENVVRFFDPFDHMGPIYTYLIYLPAYTLPWTPCWLLGLWLALRHWRTTPPNVRWLVWGLGLLFIFFTASGSRRSYYVLPLVPFAQLLGAWWLQEHLLKKPAVRPRWRTGFGIAAGLLLLILGVAYPWTNGNGGVTRFAEDVRAEAVKRAPWEQWQMVLVEVDNKLPMYLQNGGKPFYYVAQDQDFPRQGDSAAFIAWLDKTSGRHFDPQHTLIVAQFSKDDPTPLAYLGADHQVIVTQPDNGERMFKKREEGSVAFLPGR
jgi:4-amino-4-deoxy-L-arabinose transferase-like glycosyltransferase